MENEQNKAISILLKRTERKHVSILAFVILDLISVFMPEYFDITHEIAYNLLMLLSSVLLITIIVFWVKGIQDFVQNGSTKVLKKNLNIKKAMDKIFLDYFINGLFYKII